MTKYVTNARGNAIDFDAAVALMDDDLREALHDEIAPCSEQHFFRVYAERHAAKFNEDFAPYYGGAW